ncbi:WxL protein peptidoglycan domain-containing protein [Microbacterium neimengense]
MNPRSIRPRPRLIALSSAMLAVLAVLTFAVPAQAADGDEVTWTVRTASNNLGSERTNYSYTVDPGGSVSDAVTIANHGDEALDLKVYAADGSTSDEGQLSLLVAGESSQAIGAWIVPQQAIVTVAAGETVTVPFTLSVPENATPGDYAGGVVTSLSAPDAQNGVTVDRRLGIRVNLRVGGELAPSLAVENMSVAWNGGLNPFVGGDATVTYTLHNTGNAAIAAQPTARVSGIFDLLGMDAAAAQDVPPLLPGESWTQTVSVPGVPPVFALIAGVNVVPVVTDASGSTTPLETVTGQTIGAAIPWTLLVIVLLVAAAVFLLLRSRRQRSATAQQRADARVEDAVARALAEERARADAGAASAD